MAQLTSSDTGAEQGLAARAGAGDSSAFGVIYDRHFDELYDFAVRALGDPDAAAAAVASAFARAWEGFNGGVAESDVRAWLLRLGAATVAEEVEADDNGVLGPGRLPAPGDDAGAAAWEAAATSGPVAYAALDLALRREVGGEGGGDGPSTAVEDFERTAAALYLVRTAWARCPTLDGLRWGLPAEPGPRLVRSVSGHAGSCPACAAAAAVYDAGRALRELPPIPPPPGLRDEIWDELADWAAAAPRAAAPAPGSRPRSTVRTGLFAGVALAATAAVAIGSLAGGLLRPLRGSPIRDPRDVHSISHRTEATSTDPTIEMVWSRHPRAEGYSISWDNDPEGVPDTIEDLPGDATGTVSPGLDDGDWYFHLRTYGDGVWTSSVTVGPYIIDAPDDPVRLTGDDPGRGQGRRKDRGDRNDRPEPAPTPTPEATEPDKERRRKPKGDGKPPPPDKPEPRPSPEPSPSPTPQPSPTPTPLPTPTPTSTPDP